jgi:hypothetical protein
MPKLKAFLWRVVYVVLVAVIVMIVVPLLFAAIGFELPMNGAAITLLKFCVGCLIVIYVFFGGDPPYAPF